MKSAFRQPFHVVLLLCAFVSNTSAQTPNEVSGVILHDGSLFLVGNQSPQSYFEIADWGKRIGYFRLPSAHSVASEDAKDLEAIAVIGDEIVVLSEATSMLFSPDERIADYSLLATHLSRGYSQKEGFNNGFEGLATRIVNPETGQVMVAALWEGGYSGSEYNQKWNPAIVQHRLTPKSEFTATVDNCTILEMPWETLGQTMKLQSGQTTFAPRATDLVWYPYMDGKRQRWGFIVHLSCSGPGFLHRHWLCKITGCPLSDFAQCDVDIFEITTILKSTPERHFNWEGLCWYNKERSQLLLAADNKESLDFFVMALPSGWEHLSE